MLSVPSRQSPLNLCLYTKHCCKSVCQDHNVCFHREGGAFVTGRIIQMIGGPPASAYQCHSQYVIFMHFFPPRQYIYFFLQHVFVCHIFLESPGSPSPSEGGCYSVEMSNQICKTTQNLYVPKYSFHSLYSRGTCRMYVGPML